MAGFGDRESNDIGTSPVPQQQQSVAPQAAPQPSAASPAASNNINLPPIELQARSEENNYMINSAPAATPYVSPHKKPKPFSRRAGNNHPQRKGAHANKGNGSNPAAQAQKQNPVLLPNSAQEAARRRPVVQTAGSPIVPAMGMPERLQHDNSLQNRKAVSTSGYAQLRTMMSWDSNCSGGAASHSEYGQLAKRMGWNPASNCTP